MKELKPKYLPVPVTVAHAIAMDFNKSQVVILSFDPVFETTHTTTFGISPFEKENAAAVGELCTKVVGGDLSLKVNFEDFHKDMNPAILRATKDALDEIILLTDNYLAEGRPHGGRNTQFPDGCECNLCQTWDRLNKGRLSLDLKLKATIP